MSSKPDQNIDLAAYLRGQYDSLSESQQRVIEFLLSNGIDGLYMSSQQIAEQVNVNRSTIVRTAQALGFQGFVELQAALQKHFSEQFTAFNRYNNQDIGTRQIIEQISPQQAQADAHSVLQRMVQIETQKLQGLLEIIPKADFERAVDLLTDAHAIYIMGLYLSKSLALNLFYPLSLTRTGIHLLEPDTTGFTRQLAGLTERDVFFAISNIRYARPTLACIEYAKSMGATVITLTDSPFSPPARRSDLVFVIPARLWFYANSVVPFTLLNALSATLVLRFADHPPENLDKVDKIFNHLNMFMGGEET